MVSARQNAYHIKYALGGNDLSRKYLTTITVPTRPKKILEKHRSDANPHAGFRCSAFSAPTCATELRQISTSYFVPRTSYLASAPPPTVVLPPLSPPCPLFALPFRPLPQTPYAFLATHGPHCITPHYCSSFAAISRATELRQISTSYFVPRTSYLASASPPTVVLPPPFPARHLLPPPLCA